MDSGELTDMENTGVLVYREKFISKERRQKYWGYFVVGMLRGRKVRVSLVSTDAGGYDGTVKASGTATADDVFTVATGIKLTSGKTYTLSCGNNSVGYPFIRKSISNYIQDCRLTRQS